MGVYKLTKEDREVMDAIGWMAVMATSERDNSYKFLDTLNYISDDMGIQYNENINLFKIHSKDTEVGRFGIVKNVDGHCLTGLVIHPTFRNKGYFKEIINYITSEYDNIYLYTSNKYIAEALFKDDRFKSEGWNHRLNTDDLEIRFIHKR